VAQQREKVSLSELNVLLNESPTRTWELAGSLEDVLPEVRMEELTERAYASNYELRHLVPELKIEESRLKLVKAERIPNLDLQFGTDLNALPITTSALAPSCRRRPRSLGSVLPVCTFCRADVVESALACRAHDTWMACKR
jgi:hypothetical protein